jgi:hypothetical protein
MKTMVDHAEENSCPSLDGADVTPQEAQAEPPWSDTLSEKSTYSSDSIQPIEPTNRRECLKAFYQRHFIPVVWIIATSVIAVTVAVTATAICSLPGFCGTSLTEDAVATPEEEAYLIALDTQTQRTERDVIKSMIQDRCPLTDFSGVKSPQQRALAWILYDDPYTFSDELLEDDHRDDRLTQRFALATIFMGTNGNTWSNHLDGQWMESKNECNWDYGDIRCSPESVVEWLNLYGGHLSSSIPMELSLLTQLHYLDLSYNELEGSLPSELGFLTQLDELILHSNTFTGSIPSELGLLTQLTRLYLHNNNLLGTLPSELCLLTQLQSLILNHNRLTGSLPSDLGLMTQLDNLYLNDQLGIKSMKSIGLAGSIPSFLCSADVNIRIDCGEIACTCCWEAWPSTNSC